MSQHVVPRAFSTSRNRSINCSCWGISISYHVVPRPCTQHVSPNSIRQQTTYVQAIKNSWRSKVRCVVRTCSNIRFYAPAPIYVITLSRTTFVSVQHAISFSFRFLRLSLGLQCNIYASPVLLFTSAAALVCVCYIQAMMRNSNEFASHLQIQV